MFNLSEKTKRRFRFGTNAVVLMIVVMVVAVLVNLVLEQLPMTVDLTSEELYSVTDKTYEILDDLDKEVEVYALFDQAKGETDSNLASIMKYLDIYDGHAKVTVKYVDIDKNPTFLRNTVGETRAADFKAGDYLVKCGNNVRQIPQANMYVVDKESGYLIGYDAEACLTGAIVYVTSDEIPVVYVSTGSGEAAMEDYSTLMANIRNNNFDVATINLNQAEIPEDCAAVLFLSPSEDISTSVLSKLKSWFQSDYAGNVVCLMDYNKTGVELPNFNELFQLFSLKLNNDVVSETSDMCMPGYPQRLAGYIVSADDSPNANLSKDLGMFIDSRSIEVLKTTNSYSSSVALAKTTELATSTDIDTGATSTGEKVLMASGQYQAGLDVSKLYLSGSSLSLRDDYISTMGSGMDGGTLIRALNWMHNNTNEGDLIPEKKQGQNYIMTTDSSANTMGIIAAIIIPVVIMSIGFVIWLKRRHL